MNLVKLIHIYRKKKEKTKLSDFIVIIIIIWVDKVIYL